MLASVRCFSILMVIVHIPDDQGWVPAYPTSGTAIEFQFLSLFVTVSFLKVRARTRARKKGPSGVCLCSPLRFTGGTYY